MNLHKNANVCASRLLDLGQEKIAITKENHNFTTENKKQEEYEENLCYSLCTIGPVFSVLFR